ncbi:cation-binding protein [Sulfolobus acidocaldarius SUSAZ]|nr:cation-binding protein [Sulfolobus acidocaldarius SUSAZ]
MWIKNPVDLIYFEHCILRVRYSIGLSLLNDDEKNAINVIKKTHEFVVNWHAKIEDKYIFPLFGEKAKPYSNDHLLIERYGNSAIQQRNIEWIKRYVKIVLDHNLNEERNIFIDKVQAQDVMNAILKEMRSYPSYEEITGLKIDLE